MLMLVSMTLTLMQGQSGSTKANNHRSATKQAISIKLAITVGHFYVTILQTFIPVDHPVSMAGLFVQTNDNEPVLLPRPTDGRKGCLSTRRRPQWVFVNE